jgi:hypothetical protein
VRRGLARHGMARHGTAPCPPRIYFLAGVTHGSYFYGLYYFAFLECALPGVNPRPQFGQCGSIVSRRLYTCFFSKDFPICIFLDNHWVHVILLAGFFLCLFLFKCLIKNTVFTLQSTKVLIKFFCMYISTKSKSCREVSGLK